VKVLFAMHQFFPEHRAGTEVLTLGLARALRSLGHQTAVFAAKRSLPSTNLSPGAMEDYAVEGVPVRRIGRPLESLKRPFRLNYENPEMAAGLRDYIREFRPDVVHFMHLQGLSAAAIPMVKEKFGLPVLYTATDFWAICPVVDLRRHDGVMCAGPDPAHCIRCLASRQPGSRTASLVERIPGAVMRVADAASRLPLPAKPLPLRLMRDLAERPEYIKERVNGLDYILAPTELTRDLLVRNGVDPELVSVSHYGVDVSNIAAAPRGDSGTLRFGFIGTLGPHKGCDTLVRAFKKLPVEIEATLRIYGGGEEFGDYAANLERLAGGDPRITFRGTFPPERIGEVFSDMDVLVVPSRWYENTPLVVYSAFAAGVPVVALLFPLEDAEELARQLSRLAGPALVEHLRSGIGPVKTVEAYAEEMERLYNALVEREMDTF
jgi:glycosyltransferase involved in cell wall biosynthesis